MLWEIYSVGVGVLRLVIIPVMQHILMHTALAFRTTVRGTAVANSNLLLPVFFVRVGMPVRMLT